MAKTPVPVVLETPAEPTVKDVAAFVEQERAAYVDAIWQGAIDRAQVFIRAGRFGRGEYELVRAELRVARLNGDVEAVDRLEQIRYFDFGGTS